MKSRKQSDKPPKIPEYIIGRMFPDNNYYTTVSDIEEDYKRLLIEKGVYYAKMWYWLQVLSALPHYFAQKLKWSIVMFKNYTKIFFRNITRQKAFSFIKIFALSLGFAACILIYLFISDELSFDKFHENGNRLFQFVSKGYDSVTGEEIYYDDAIPPPVGPEVKQSIPGIEYQSRFVNGSGVIQYKENFFRELISLADPDFFSMFTFPLLRGDAKTALNDPHNVVFSESFASKYFGKENPVDKMITITFGDIKKDYIVTGVFQDVPSNSSIQCDILVNFENLPDETNNPTILQNWDGWYCWLFVQLLPEVSIDQVETGLSRFTDQYYGENIQSRIKQGRNPFKFGLHTFEDIYLRLNSPGNSRLSTSYLLSAIALTILIIACLNFMNLSIGLSSVRSMEVGIRKILGAKQKQLSCQFCGEALLMSFSALLFGLIFASLILSRFNSLSEKNLSLSTLLNPNHIFTLLVITFFTGILAGIYPALIISSFRPLDIIRRKLKIGGNDSLTKSLIVIQFALSITLAVSAVILGKQVSFLVTKDIGYDRNGLVVIFEASDRICNRFRNEILTHSQIQGVTACSREFGVFLPSTSINVENRRILYHFTRVDPHFLKTLKLELIRGRDFSTNLAAEKDSIIVNERFMDELGPEYRMGDPLGDITKGYPYNCRIIGVVKNCHFQSARREINPMLLYVGRESSPRRDKLRRIFVRVDSSNFKESMAFLERAWTKIQPEKPFIYSLQDEILYNLFQREQRWATILRYSSVFSILLACLGVFGLTALTLDRRKKEISIRKVLGASMEQIVFLVNKEFLLLMSIANVIAWPIVYLLMRKILQNYPYRIGIGIHYFVFAGVASLIIAVLTILYFSIKTATANPVDSLRYE